ncbi:MAG: branched-chain amino acid ABC transporter substrate-binding protein [Proteobacteria bacterium]|nr:branched-chain amino acid ABC transporter substrate-binding protein [Pseudomonadota bacterium]
MKRLRYGILLLVPVLFLVLGSACESDKDTAIKIGVVGPYSGNLAPLGIPPRNAVILAAEKINAAGGIRGRKVEIIAEDDVCKPEQAIDVASRLVDEGVVAVVGHICSGATIAAMSVYRDNDIPVVSPSATAPILTLSGKNSLFFRTIPHDAAQAVLQIQFILENLKAKKVAVVHDKSDYGKGLSTLIKEGLEKADVNIVLFEGISPDADDYSTVVREIKETDPDVVAFGGYHPEGSKIVTQSRRKNITAHFISGDALKDPSFIEMGGKYAEGVYISSTIDISRNPATIEVTKALSKRGQRPGNYGLQAHAGITAVFNAIEKSGSTKAKDIGKILRSESVSTTLGNISFDEKGDVVGSGFTIYRIDHGRFVNVKW